LQPRAADSLLADNELLVRIKEALASSKIELSSEHPEQRRQATSKDE
jgi:hypothetical protein